MATRESIPPAAGPNPAEEDHLRASSGHVVSMATYSSRDMVMALEDLLGRAQQGSLKGFAFSIKTGPRSHRIGFMGDYWEDPCKVLIAASRMQFKANELITARDEKYDAEMLSK